MPGHAGLAESSQTDFGPAHLKETQFTPEHRRRLSGPGLRTFLNIADHWQLSEAERLRVLGLPGRSTYHGWVARARRGEEIALPVDVLLRISGVLGIHKGLRTLFGSEQDASSWLRGPHTGLLFGGQPPLALITNGTQDGIMLVRRYLDAWRGGNFAAPNAVDRDAPPLSDSDIVFV